MKKLLLIASLTCIFFMAQADIYKWQDSQGGIHYSDRPKEGASKVDLPSFQSYSAPKSSVKKQEEKSESIAEEAGAEVSVTDSDYKSILIAQPETESTIRNNQGFFVVAVQLEPALKKGDRLQLFFDGSKLGEPQTALIFQLNNIYRGTHTIRVAVVDAKGKVLLKSEPITIFMHRPRINMGGGGG